MTKQHIVFLTEGEIVALLNLAGVAIRGYPTNDYVQGFANDGKTAVDKLIQKNLELKRNDAKRE